MKEEMPRSNLVFNIFNFLISNTLSAPCNQAKNIYSGFCSSREFKHPENCIRHVIFMSFSFDTRLMFTALVFFCVKCASGNFQILVIVKYKSCLWPTLSLGAWYGDAFRRLRAWDQPCKRLSTKRKISSFHLNYTLNSMWNVLFPVVCTVHWR